MKKAALHNLGCKVNSYEIEVMSQKLRENGYEIVPFEQKADVYIINTCSVTNIADRKSRQMLHKAKKENPTAVIVAAGCYVQTAGADKVISEDVDIVVGNNKKGNIVELLDEYFSQKKDGENASLSCVIDINKSNEYENMQLLSTDEHTRAVIKIQDGCNQFCSYCIIPFARGRVRSRKSDEIVTEIESLVKKGYKEFVLTGIHLSSYGSDFCEDMALRNDFTKSNRLLEVIKTISLIEGVERIRLGSLEPRIITEEFVNGLIDAKKVCPHFHLSLQSGCDNTLKRMNRHYTADEFYERVLLLRDIYVSRTGSNPAVTTDVIVGFPGETEEDFNECFHFLEKIKFYETHIFKYSKRQGTKAASMKDQIPESVKTLRSHVLIELNRKNMADFISQFDGKRVEVLVEEEVVKDNKTYYRGYTNEYIRILFEKGGFENLEGSLVTGYLVEGDVCIIQDIALKS